MTISNSEQKDLRDLLKFPPLGLLKYSADPIAQRRVGQVLSKASMQLHIKQGAARSVTKRAHA
jgi:hypothetical protein